MDGIKNFLHRKTLSGFERDQPESNGGAFGFYASGEGKLTLKTEVTFTYKNYRGEISVRLVRPVMIAFGTTGFHPDPQWLLHGWDINKDAERTFAMKDIRDWEPAP